LSFVQTTEIGLKALSMVVVVVGIKFRRHFLPGLGGVGKSIAACVGWCCVLFTFNDPMIYVPNQATTCHAAVVHTTLPHIIMPNE